MCGVRRWVHVPQGLRRADPGLVPTWHVPQHHVAQQLVPRLSHRHVVRGRSVAAAAFDTGCRALPCTFLLNVKDNAKF